MVFPITIILLALLFDFYNGMNDAANSIATVVSTRVLTPFHAVLWATFFNFVAAFVFGTAVAKTIGAGLVDASVIDYQVIFSALIGAIVLTSVCTHFGLPISVSHAIIGGLVGAALIKVGPASIIFSGFIKVVIFIFIAPVMGYVISYFFSIVILWIVRNKSPRTVDKYFRKLQLVSAALFSLSHGSNDAQKTMGIITMVLILMAAGGDPSLVGKSFNVPFWVVITSHSVIAFGTMVGGWKVIKTLGMRMTKLSPFGGFSAETSAGMTIVLATLFGIPVSTTHTITGAITGVGAIKGFSAVRWGVARNILWAWVLTIPLSGFISGLMYWIAVTFVQ
ncbi:MAG: inorganic phosphate transporter [Ignavibacteria bacterium]|nr:inorganic phosphate transporter [Ignavibacteria bacterium]OIO23498.1 MAG: anion permease [Ignavibacteria bacterium CG1_02_37_35]PIX93345.1 MAG: anion permease [Ignavibacteria bacterium CG_4_10_14_3_um_filter_37_18]